MLVDERGKGAFSFLVFSVVRDIKILEKIMRGLVCRLKILKKYDFFMVPLRYCVVCIIWWICFPSQQLRCKILRNLSRHWSML